MSTPFSSRHVNIAGPSSRQTQSILMLLKDIREIIISDKPGVVDDQVEFHEETDLLEQLKTLASTLDSHGHPLEANALLEVHELGVTSTQFGGLGLRQDDNSEYFSEQDTAELLFLVSAQLEALNSADRAKQTLVPLSVRPSGRRGMTLSEKIFAAHDVDRRGEVKAGDMIRVDVDWIIASEFSWRGMERWYDRLGKPGIYRNDRFWLAGDHLVDPRILEHPKIKPYVESAERAKRQFRMTENQGMNYTIMHTEFCRERAQPGMLVIGSDSHTCSAGSVSCLAIGLGVADVLLPLVTGETWFKIPETVEIRFVNKPKPGISGKDVILYILKELKRNTVAAERVVEYTGPGVEYLSCDARFAIANMTTEFGGVTGIFVPDTVTQEFINKRKKPKYRSHSTYFRPDPDAQYVETYVIDLAQVQSFVARYPKPDDVVPVGEVAGLQLQGCFIGACTTAEEDLVLAALVLEEAMKRGAKPARTGIRKMIPGSLPILHKLRSTGLVDIYQRAGWEIGVPSCSYCVGASADKAARGETWLTSQNRNFENRMGPGAFGNLASAVTVAASSFDMKVTDPGSLLDAIDIQRLHDYMTPGVQQGPPSKLQYVEPGANASISTEATKAKQSSTDETTASYAKSHLQVNPLADLDVPAASTGFEPPESLSSMIRGKVQLLGDFIDTDALAPAEGATQANVTKDILGSFCLFHTHPKFRQRVKDGHTIVVAGEAFGCGSSREDAVFALQGAGVQCVIAKSFAFIYARNQPNLGLLGFEMKNPRFWELVADEKEIKIDIDRTEVYLHVDGQGTWEFFPFQLGTMQRRLLDCGGAEKAFGRYGKSLWSKLAAPSSNKEQITDVAGKISNLPQLEQGADKGKTDW